MDTLVGGSSDLPLSTGVDLINELYGDAYVISDAARGGADKLIGGDGHGLYQRPLFLTDVRPAAVAD